MTSDESLNPDADGTSSTTSSSKKDRKHLPVWQESILLLAVALGLAILIKALFVQAFYIPSPSMEPGLVKNDRILVQKVSYWFGRTPQRGDVIVFKDPGQWLTSADTQAPSGMAGLLSKVGLYPTGGHLVKRVIGVEGDVIECCDEQGRIKINGKPIDESSFLQKRVSASCDAEIDDWIGARSGKQNDPCSWTIGPIPAGKMLVLGDNRENSADSRAHLCGVNEDPCTQSPWVDTDLVVGKVFTLIWPQDRWRWISRPSVFDGVPDQPSASLLEKAKKLDTVPGT